ncbi:MAG: ribosomal protein S18-alanine N-acetyltransferase [Eubacterium sp.]
MITIREMIYEDAKLMAEMDSDIFTTPWSEESFEQSFLNEYTTYVVALDNNNIIGYCGMYKSFDEGHITNMAVVEQYRRQKIASRLLEYIFNIVKEEGIRNITLEVRKSNYAAIELYNKFGFKTVGVRANFYEKPTEGAVIMWKYGI